MSDALLQLLHMALAPVLAPALTGVVRVTKSRLLGRRGPSVWQPYRDLARLLRKEAVVAESASWLFLSAPYLVFAAIWLAASLVPGLTLGLSLGPTADLIALVALLGAARFFTALAGMDVGTSFGGIGSSREMMIATLAEPAMLLVVLTMALTAGTTRLPEVAEFLISAPVTVRVSLALALVDPDLKEQAFIDALESEFEPTLRLVYGLLTEGCPPELVPRLMAHAADPRIDGRHPRAPDSRGLVAAGSESVRFVRRVHDSTPRSGDRRPWPIPETGKSPFAVYFFFGVGSSTLTTRAPTRRSQVPAGT